MKSGENNENTYKTKRTDKINSLNYNITTNLDNLKKIFIEKKEINKKNNKHNFLVVKSKSKNDIIRNNRKKPKNQDQEKNEINKNANINVIREKEKELENINEKKIEENNEDKNNIIQKSNKKKVDTRNIFNNIKNNIYNFDEFYPMKKKPIKVNNLNYFSV